jgi:hypothetical protein
MVFERCAVATSSALFLLNLIAQLDQQLGAGAIL